MECAKWDEHRFGMSFDELTRSIEAARNNRLWFLKSLQELRDKYLNKWVAVHKKRIVAADEDYDALIKAVLKKGIQVAEIEVHLVTPEDLLWVL